MQKIIQLLLALVCFVLLTTPFWFPFRYHVTIDIGSGTEAEHVWGFFMFHDPETQGSRSFRWMAERGTFTIPYALRMAPLVLDLTACRCFAQEFITPVDLFINQRYLTSLATTAQWRTYHVLVPSYPPYPEQAVMGDMRAPTTPDSYQRPLGVALDTIQLRHLAPARDMTLLGGITLIVGLVLVGVGYWSRSVVFPLLVSGSWMLCSLFYVPRMVALEHVLGLLVVGLLLLWLPLWTTRLRLAKGRIQHTYAVLATVLTVWLILSPQVLGSWVVDDAYISFHYANRFIHGHGLIFNLGERVEGYTNFLWTMILAGTMALGGDPVIVSAILNMLLALGSVALTFSLATHLVQPSWAWIAPVILSVTSPFLIYSTRNSGMETVLFTLLTLGTLLLLFQQRWRLAGIVTAGMLLTRPDGIILAIIATLYATYCGWSRMLTSDAGFYLAPIPDPPPTEGRRDAVSVPLHPVVHPVGLFQQLWSFPTLQYGLATTVVYGPYFLWRWSYYGYLLPNTFYAKVDGTSEQAWLGVRYLWAFGQDYLLLWFGIVGVVIGAIFHAKTHTKTSWHKLALLVIFFVGFSGYIIAVGGDWMPGARFFVVTTPVLAVLIAWGIGSMLERFPRLIPWGMVLLFAMVMSQGVVLAQDQTCQKEVDHTRRLREVGRWLHTHTRPDALIATEYAGAIPYYSQRTTLDILGLTDTHIAHLSSGDDNDDDNNYSVRVTMQEMDYVLQQAPDIIPRKGSAGIWTHPDFAKLYELRWFAGPEGHALGLYVRRGSTAIITSE